MARLDSDCRRFYRMALEDLVTLPAPVAVGLIETLPMDAAIYWDPMGRPIALLIAARQVEVTWELLRVVLGALGVKRNRLPKPMTLLSQAAPHPDIRSADPLAWAAAMGARIVKADS